MIEFQKKHHSNRPNQKLEQNHKFMRNKNKVKEKKWNLNNRGYILHDRLYIVLPFPLEHKNFSKY